MNGPLITLDTAVKSYTLRGGGAAPVLRSVTLQIMAGDHVAILGKSGSGKSTLLNLIAGLDRPTSGRVQVAGADLGSLGENQLARWRGQNLGVVFQFFQLLPTLTIAENILIAMDFVGKIPAAARRARTGELLELVALADQAAKLPSTLSGGQQQRAALARALANDPAIILADEPTGNLDTETAADVDAVFHRLTAQGKTLVIVTHDATLAQGAHRLIRLKDGEIVADERQNPRAA